MCAPAPPPRRNRRKSATWHSDPLTPSALFCFHGSTKHVESGTTADPHEVEQLAAVDNKGEPEDLPLAPRS